jgi:hypothetical protein
MVSRFLIIAVFNSSTGELLSSSSLSCIVFCISNSIVSRNSGSDTLNCSDVNRCYGLVEQSHRFHLSIIYPPLWLLHAYIAYYWGNYAYYSLYYIAIVPWESINGCRIRLTAV